MIKSDNLIPLVGGAYQARSKISNYEICENLFPEINPQETEAPTPVTHYPREGKRPLSAPPVQGGGRGIFTLSNGALYAVVGPYVYAIDQNWEWTQIGQISNATNPVSMSDNGTTAVLVDGSAQGYSIAMAGNAFGPIVDDTGTFLGAVRADFSDTYFAFNQPGTNGWIVSLSNQVAFNALVVANADAKPDPIVTLAFNIRQMWLIKALSTEVWYLAGSTPFPYQGWPNIFIPYGCAAAYSLVQADVDLFWLARNPQGQSIAVQTKGYGVEAISTRALEYEWSTYRTVADCIGGTFQQGGHTFIIFHFPTADKTWCYDLATKQWHRRTWVDQNGSSHRERTAFYASVGPQGGYQTTIVGQDWATGQIYALDPKFYTDNGSPIVFKRTFPHVMKDMRFITHVSFIADFETGGIQGDGVIPGSLNDFNNDYGGDFGPNNLGPQAASPPSLSLRYSDDGGNRWSNFREKPLLSSGKYRAMLRWRGLGMARDRVYELSWSYNGPSALQGAYLEPLEHGS